MYFVKGQLDLSTQTAQSFMGASRLWDRHPDADLWRAVAAEGVARIDTVTPARAQRKLKKAALDMSATNHEATSSYSVTLGYIERKIEQFGLKTSAPKPPKTKRGPKSKTQTVLTIEQATAALCEVRGMLARKPALEGCFSLDALETIKKAQ